MPIEQLHHITGAEKRTAYLLKKSLLRHKQPGQRHHSHVTVPRPPLAHLIVRHSQMALGILKISLDEMTLPLVLGEGFVGSIARGVAQRVFDGIALVLTDEQPALACLGLAGRPCPKLLSLP